MDKDSPRSEVSGSIQAPSSKSYAQRAVAAALLAKGCSTLRNMELCDDTAVAMKVAEQLGAKIKKIDNSTYEIEGGLDPVSRVVNIGESGLSARMFTPIAALCGSPVRIEGRGSINTRPMDMLVGPLRNLGVEVHTNDGLLPVTVHGPLAGGETAVDGQVSSQFITGLLMAVPLAHDDTCLYVAKPNSTPYIDMTIHLLSEFGIKVGHNDHREFFIEGGQSYTPREYNVEGDWSGASCLLVAGAVAGEVTVGNLNPLSRQADVAIIDALLSAGAEIETTPDSITVRKKELRAFEFDATHCPDLFPALVALAANCPGVSRIVGTSRLTHKESDRAEALRAEFSKMGVDVDIDQPDVMKVRGGKIRSSVVSSRNDHRIAMAAAVMGLVSDGVVTIKDAQAVNKSYPDFWQDLDSIRA